MAGLKTQHLKLRQYSKDELGDRFDLRAFHDEVLAGGAVPLDVLSSRIHEWVGQQKTQATAGGAIHAKYIGRNRLA